MSLVETQQLTKVYGQGETEVLALDHVNLKIEAGEFVAVMGPSGCGKSTLLHLVGGLDRPTEGSVILNGHNLAALDDTRLTTVRRQQIGFIFQFFNLIPVLSAQENVSLPLVLDGARAGTAAQKATDWLTRLGLEDQRHRRPDQLSGGQQQRVAIARALISEPALVLADEPTGNLDSRAGDEVAGLLRRVVDEWGRSILMVTHDPRIAAYADRIIFLKDGRVIDETRLNAASVGEADRVKEKVEAL
ncbi:MAG TPA: ABC transporter ATP-binding protein [Anaerolineaceae bacterium]|nr:ABC transporter ATP-binding protein [Anaerolineaceae bacterium]HOD06309.1 ABC transporter ATP-binding protein [Anaerolineaceae bacterium]HOG79722.1 ABC transporter ATP-binding protein [Anaerolineaceae bacterium]